MSKEEDWNDVQEQAVSTVILYLQPSMLKQIGEHEDCKKLFDALSAQFHRKELFYRLYTTLKLMSFKMKDSSTKIQDHIDSFNDLAIDFQNLGKI